jgi:hypothetical protein
MKTKLDRLRFDEWEYLPGVTKQEAQLCIGRASFGVHDEDDRAIGVQIVITWPEEKDEDKPFSYAVRVRQTRSGSPWGPKREPEFYATLDEARECGKKKAEAARRHAIRAYGKKEAV